MSKHKKPFASGTRPSRLSENTGLEVSENRSDDDDHKSPGSAKKQIDGIWVVIFFFGALMLVLFLGWLTSH